MKNYPRYYPPSHNYLNMLRVNFATQQQRLEDMKKKSLLKSKLNPLENYNAIPGTAMVAVGPDENGKYKIKELIGTADQIEKVPIGVRWQFDNPAFTDLPLSLDYLKLFQQTGNIEAITIQNDSNQNATKNIF